MENKDKNFIIDSDKLIKHLIDNEMIELIGIGDRYNDKFSGLHSDKFRNDNTYNWEIADTNEDDTISNYYNLSNNFNIEETDDILIISKHVGVDIRGGYENDIIYIKNDNISFYEMIHDSLELAEEVK